MGDMIHDFGVNKVEKLQRSRWNFNMSNVTNFRQGALIPLAWCQTIPSSTIQCDMSSLVRLALTLAKPTMGDMYFTYGAYFVPYRIMFKGFEEMFGDGKPSEWSNPTEYVLPNVPFDVRGSITNSTAGVGYDCYVYNRGSMNTSGHIFSIPGNLANYLGLPETYVGTAELQQIDIAPFAAYERIWSDFWRDENYQNVDPDLEKIYNITPGYTGAQPNIKLELHYANRFHDYFTSLLPSPQKGTAVSSFSSLVVMPTLENIVDITTGATGYVQFGPANAITPITSGMLQIGASKLSTTGTAGSTVTNIQSSNLGISLGVDEIRSAFALQRAKERNARCGSRFVEAMLGTFEAHLPNAVAQRAEFLGGNTIPLNKTSVPSTDATPGKLGAFSATGGNQSVFVKTFNEPGIVMIVGCARVKHKYTKGISPFFQKFRRYDFYDPAFAHISEQPVKRKQLIALSDDSAEDVIGFNEAWVEYKKPIEMITGNLRYKSGQADINAWTFSDTWGDGSSLYPEIYYPENGDEISRCCVDYNSTMPDWVFIGDFKINMMITAPMPIYSIPGLVDHLVA